MYPPKYVIIVNKKCKVRNEKQNRQVIKIENRRLDIL